MKLIENTSELISFCQELNRKPFIAVDLEFLREKSYYAKLCLIQVAAPDTAAIIDPLAPGIELEAFFAVLHNPEVVKVFHSGRQDIEIIYHQAGFIPEPLFDTQTAAQVFGFGEAISYENLVKTILGIQLDKSCRLSDWSLRPLDAKQLEYALSDVTHLVPVYEHLRGKLAESGREHWLDEEFAALADPETYIVHPEDVWQKIKHRSHNGRLLTVLRELAAWRERRAQSKDTPRQSIIRDDCLLNIAAACPDCREDLEKIRNIRQTGRRNSGSHSKSRQNSAFGLCQTRARKNAAGRRRGLIRTFAPASENPLAGTRRNSQADCFRRRSQTAGGFFRQEKPRSPGLAF